MNAGTCGSDGSEGYTLKCEEPIFLGVATPALVTQSAGTRIDESEGRASSRDSLIQPVHDIRGQQFAGFERNEVSGLGDREDSNAAGKMFGKIGGL